MGKNTRAVKEFTKEQRLIKQNQALKKELSHLRKQIQRLDGNRFETLRQMCADAEEGKRFDENINQISTSSEAMKRDWACRKCESGILEIVLYSKLGITHYYRKCNSCDHRTRGKRYEESVKGILKDDKFD